MGALAKERSERVVLRREGYSLFGSIPAGAIVSNEKTVASRCWRQLVALISATARLQLWLVAALPPLGNSTASFTA
jgi:hypothetical protein